MTSHGDSTSELYDQLRPRAFAIAYQMLSSASEAEDVVQEAFLRMHQTQQKNEPISSPRAYIATLTTRLAIDQLRSARSRREQYVGEWLPEPLLAEPTPAERAEIADSLSLAFLVMLESLSPQQRAAFLLREVFEYPYAEVAEIIGSDVDSTRHLVARARHHVREHRPRYHTTRRQHDELAQRFFAAAENGDLEALESLLADDVAMHGDGGGKVQAITRPVIGQRRVAQILSKGMPKANQFGLSLQPAHVNGEPGAVVFDAQSKVVGVIGLHVVDDRIQEIHSIVNPDKLRHLGYSVGDISALLKRRRRQRRD